MLAPSDRETTAISARSILALEELLFTPPAPISGHHFVDRPSSFGAAAKELNVLAVRQPWHGQFRGGTHLDGSNHCVLGEIYLKTCLDHGGMPALNCESDAHIAVFSCLVECVRDPRHYCRGCLCS